MMALHRDRSMQHACWLAMATYVCAIEYIIKSVDYHAMAWLASTGGY